MDELVRSRLVPLLTVEVADHADAVGDALVRAGLPVVEVTLRTPAGLGAIARLARRADLLVGAGTVTTSDQVDAAVDAGARYVVSPGVSARVVERCRSRGVAVVPGAVTATEIMAALELGVGLVKFFPAAQSGGADAVAALAAPFGNVQFLPTGGINGADARRYLALPSVAAVGGSWMLPRGLVEARDAAALAEHVAVALEDLP